jgi:hypothetical protein
VTSSVAVRAAHRPGIAIFIGGVGCAATGGYLLTQNRLVAAIALCASPLLIWLLGQTRLLLAALGASIPFTNSLTSGGGFNLAPSDVIVVVMTTAIFFEAVASGSFPGWTSLRVLKKPVVQYACFMLVLLSVHLDIWDVLKTGQRFELFLLPLVVGAYAFSTGRHREFLKGYVIAATLLAVAWPFDHGLGQKNPVGQMIANALLLLLALPELRAYWRLAIVLVPSLLYTGSRGAILGTVIGLVVVLAFRSARPDSVASRVFATVAVGVAAFTLLPTALQSRLTTLTPGEGSRSAYAIKIRQQFQSDAETVIRAHPVVGVGVGNYRAPNSPPGSPPQDPHNVLLLQAAEGGYGLAMSFVLLVAGLGIRLFRSRGAPLVAAAAAVSLGTIAHGMVDVYWVRATPVLGWVLVGMACAAIARQLQAAPGIPA